MYSGESSMNAWVSVSRCYRRRIAFISSSSRRGTPCRGFGHVSTRDRPFRVAVVGSGPAGFYTAYKVMSKLEDSIVDMYESLPVPFGLVRFGVAPDHPEVKNCQDKFREVARSPRFNFIGNIAIGSDLPLTSLKPHYDAMVLAYGASKDRRLNIPGESSLGGVYSARAFVGWYNGLPEYANLAPDLTVGEEAVIIGQGNVALDVARTLLTDVDRLRKTDMTEFALDALSKSRVKRVQVVGRRGPMQAAFTIKEVRELMDLPLLGFHPIDPSLLPSDASKLPRAAKRIARLLSRGSKAPVSSVAKAWDLRFFLAPTAFQASTSHPDRVRSIDFEKTSLQNDDPLDPSAKVRGTGQQVELPTSLAFRSIGYKSESLPGLVDLGVPFDDRLGIIPNDPHGRVLSPGGGPGDQSAGHVPGMYTAGWAKRGPTGVIASTMNDAFATADVIAGDWVNNAKSLNAEVGGGTGLGWEGVAEEARRRGLRRVSWQDWEAIDAAERARGRRAGKEREKLASVDEMLEVLDG